MARTMMRNQGQMIDGFVTLAKLDQDMLVGGQTLSLSSDDSAILTGGAAVPTFASQFITKAYADTLKSGFSDKYPVRVLSDADVDITGTTPTSIVDGVTLADGDRVILSGQTNAAENGIYDFAVATHVFSRSADSDNTPNGEMAGGVSALVLEGTVYGGSTWSITAPTGVIVLGTDAITWGQVNKLGDYQNGDGLALNGVVFSVVMSQLIQANAGLVVDVNNDLGVDLDTASGLGLNGNALSIQLTASGGLSATGSALSVVTSDFVDTNQGLAINLGNIGVDLVANGGLSFNTGAIEVTVADIINSTNGGLVDVAGNISINAGNGLILNGNSLDVDPTDASLTVAASGVSVNLDTNSALVLNAGGLNVTVDGSTIVNSTGTLGVGAAGINETHLDVGSGVNQIDAQSFSVVTTGNYVAAGNVDSALSALDTQLGTNTTNIQHNTDAITLLQSGAGTNRVVGEVLIITLGIPNDTTTLANTPVGGVALYADGDRLRPGAGADYQITGAAITFEAGWDLDANDVVQADYMY